MPEPAVWPAPPAPVVDGCDLPFEPSRERVKLLHVITRLAGGSGGNTLLSAIGMDADRYEVWLAGGAGGRLWERARAAGVRTVEIPTMVERISPAEDLATLRTLRALIRRERFDIVHTHCAKAGAIGRVAARLTGAPVVVHTYHAFPFHGYMGAARRAAYVGVERAVGRLTDRTFGVSPRVARDAVAMRLARPGTATVVPSAVELDGVPDVPDPALRRELGLPEGAPVVGTVGRLVFQKAPLDFVRMAATVAARRPDARFVVVGDASLESAPLDRAAREEARRLGVDVVFTGFRADAARVASLFDVFVISSLYEGLGRSLTEAMASGRPVVATAVNGVPDLVEPGATGLLAPPRRPDLLAAGVLWLLDHPLEARRIGAEARRRVRSRIFEPATMCGILDREYAALLGLPPPRPEAGPEGDRVPPGPPADLVAADVDVLG
ncbi:MAG TPA: glycosyltransferase family 4 protein [Actinomycetota bacterium]